MGALLEIRTRSGVAVRPLATSTLLGRHRACTWPVPEARIPLYWLELRWVGYWAWRVLVGEDETRGPGKVQAGGWRRLAQGDRIVGPADVEVRLVGGEAPGPFAVEVAGGAEVLADDALDAVIEAREDGAWPVGAEDDLGREAPLADGEIFTTAGRVLRFHDAQIPSRTVRAPVSLEGPGCHLEVRGDGGAWSLEVVEGAETVRVAGEYVRVIVPYVEVRRADMPPDGWLELDAAHFRWQQVGGSAESARERIAQDRSRLCRALAAAGVGGASGLFETRRGPEGWVTRVRLPAEQLSIV